MTRQELHPHDRYGRFTRGPIRPYPSLVGKKFGHLKVLRFAGIEPRADGLARIWKCRCECSRIIFLSTNKLQGGSHHNRSNGKHRCCSPQCPVAIKRAIALGHAHRKHGHCLVSNYVRHNSPTWTSWRSMHQRVREHRPGYKTVRICKRWNGLHGFERFLLDLGKRPLGRTLDRYPNPKGDYKPSNCRWATGRQQNLNKSMPLREIALKAWKTKRLRATA